MAWSGGISIIYISLTYSLTNECSRSRSTDYTLGVAHNTSCILQLSPRSLRLHIGMCSRRSLNGLVISANARFHPSCCSTKIAPPVPSCKSPFHVHSRLLCHEHYLSPCKIKFMRKKLCAKLISISHGSKLRNNTIQYFANLNLHDFD